MSKVKLLPPEVISQIAAGEIIERPASVVKELLENSLDAGADTIEIHLKDAGKTLIHIKDNGSGIEQEDIETIFLRHATSKITASEDLFNIHSLGFRGEALYSVAAISDTVLKSKTHTQETGFEIHLRGGTPKSLKPCTFNSHGTDIEIKELFFNMPARRKFLKSKTTELNQILSIFTNYALRYNHCRFLLTHQGKDLLNLAPTQDLLERISDTLNLDKNHMIFTEHECVLEGQEHKITMILGDINITRTRRDMQFLFVNNRPVYSKNISFHLNKTYNLIMPDGSFPFFAVFLDIPASEVDVNIHPTKREVKIKKEQNLCSLLRSVCEQALMTHSDIKQAGPFTFDSHPTQGRSFIERARSQSYGTETTHPYSPTEKNYETPENYKQSNYSLSFPVSDGTTDSLAIVEKGSDLFTSKKDNLQTKLTEARFIGCFIDKYLLFEDEKSLFLIDQHAAAERIAYESLITQIQKGQVETQMLLSPISVSLSVSEMLIWEDCVDLLKKIGFETTLLDKKTIAVHSCPQLIKNIEHSLKQLLGGETIATADPASIARRACRSSIMSGDRLTKDQAIYLRDQLIGCLDPFICPHGRPTVLEMNEDFLDKQFLRG